MFTLPLFAHSLTTAKLTPFLLTFFPPPDISSFWETSIAIISSGTQKVLLSLMERKYSIESSLLTSSPSMTLTYLLFSIAPLTAAPPLTFPLLPLLLPFLAHERCFRIWVQITYQFFYQSLSLWSFTPTSVPLLSVFRKFSGITMLLTLTLTTLMLLLSSLLWH